MTPFIAEIIGTTLLIILGGGVVANVELNKTIGNNSGWIVVTTGWALAVYVAVVVTGPFSGAHINPAVSIGLAVAGEFPWETVPSYVLAQMIDATKDGDTKKAVFCTAPAIRHRFFNLVGEIVGTFVLVFTILNFTDASLADSNQLVGLGSLGALPVAFLVWAIGLSLGGTTGYAINPARDLGPRLMHAILPIKEKASNDWGYSWIPVMGPIIGASLAALLAILLA